MQKLWLIHIFQIEKSCGVINKRHLSSSPTLFLTLVYMNEEKMSPFSLTPIFISEPIFGGSNGGCAVAPALFVRQKGRGDAFLRSGCPDGSAMV